MTKYYFISWRGKSKKTGDAVIGHSIMRVTESSLFEICADIADKNSVKFVVITCLKDLTKSEYIMLKGDS